MDAAPGLDLELGAVGSADDAVARRVEIGVRPPRHRRSAIVRAGVPPGVESARPCGRRRPWRASRSNGPKARASPSRKSSNRPMRRAFNGLRAFAPGGGPPGRPPLAELEQERLCGLRAHRRFARGPFVIVLVHVGVVFDVAAERTVEVPEPVRAELVPPRPPEGLIAGLDEARPGQHQLRRPPHVEGEVLAALHVDRRLDEEERVMVLRARRAQKRAGSVETVGDLEAQALAHRRPPPTECRARSRRRAKACAASPACPPTRRSCLGRAAGPSPAR